MKTGFEVVKLEIVTLLIMVLGESIIGVQRKVIERKVADGGFSDHDIFMKRMVECRQVKQRINGRLRGPVALNVHSI